MINQKFNLMRIFETIDKSGRKIYLTKERLLHIQKHPYMHNSLDKIKETLSKPNKIIPESRKHLYFRYYKELNQYLLIAVKYLNGEGFIITAYYVRNLKWLEFIFIMMKNEII